jgi:hypothetical protein
VGMAVRMRMRYTLAGSIVFLESYIGRQKKRRRKRGSKRDSNEGQKVKTPKSGKERRCTRTAMHYSSQKTAELLQLLH